MLEHVPSDQQPDLANACFRHLRPNGRVILTVPSRAVDPIVHMMQRLQLAEAQTLYQHYGFNPARTRPLFEGAGFTQMTHRRFELGLNHLFVFVKPDPLVGE